VCAAPMGTLPAGGKQPGGDVLASWRRPGQPPGEGTGPGVPAVRVLRAGLDRRLAGSGMSRARQLQQAVILTAVARRDRGRFLRHGSEPPPGVAAAPADRRAGRPAGGPGPRMGRDRNRGVRAGVLRESVRVASQAQAAQLTGPAAWRLSSSVRLVRMMRSSRVQANMRLIAETSVFLAPPTRACRLASEGQCVSGFFLGSKELDVQGPKPGPVNARCLLGCVG